MRNQYLELEEAVEVESEDDEVRMRHLGRCWAFTAVQKK